MLARMRILSIRPPQPRSHFYGVSEHSMNERSLALIRVGSLNQRLNQTAARQHTAHHTTAQRQQTTQSTPLSLGARGIHRFAPHATHRSNSPPATAAAAWGFRPRPQTASGGAAAVSTRMGTTPLPVALPCPCHANTPHTPRMRSSPSSHALMPNAAQHVFLQQSAGAGPRTPTARRLAALLSSCPRVLP